MRDLTIDQKAALQAEHDRYCGEHGHHWVKAESHKNRHPGWWYCRECGRLRDVDRPKPFPLGMK